jgi:polyketide cyclase/dehydrase/lipid transport protein
MSKPLDIVVRTIISAPVAQCFDYIVPVDLSHIFRAYLFLPGVSRTDETGRWQTPGLVRIVYFTDGSQAREQLLTVEPSRSFTYEITQFTGINKFLVSRIYGVWNFNQNSLNQTEIEWTYSLSCHNRLTQLVARLVVAPMLKTYLQRALRILKQDLEKYA